MQYNKMKYKYVNWHPHLFYAKENAKEIAREGNGFMDVVNDLLSFPPYKIILKNGEKNIYIDIFQATELLLQLFKNSLWKTYANLVILEAMAMSLSSGKYGTADQE